MFNKNQLDILNGRVCPKCGSSSLVTGASYLYREPQDFDYVAICGQYPDCYHFTTCWPNTSTPRGRLAGIQLWEERRDLYRNIERVVSTGKMTKEEIEKEIYDILTLPEDYRDIYFLSVRSCQRATSHCLRKYLSLTYDPNKDFIVKMVRRKKGIVVKQLPNNYVVFEFDKDLKRQVVHESKVFQYNASKKKRSK